MSLSEAADWDLIPLSGLLLFKRPDERYLNSMLPPHAIEEFQKLYFEKYGVRLSFEEATQKATDLLRFYKIIFTTHNQDDLENGQKKT